MMRPKIVGVSRRLTPAGLLLMAAFVASCNDSVETTQPTVDPAPASAAAAAKAQGKSRGIDAEFSRLAAAVPGFGGMYYDKSGTLNVYVKSQAGAAAKAADVVGRLRAVGGPAVKDRLRQNPNVVLRAAKYDYAELQGWKSRLGALFSVRGVVFTDINESQNRLQVGVAPGASQNAVEKALSRTGVPREAVTIRRSSPITNMVKLRDRFRPVPGGVQIFFPAPSEGPNAAFICSHGFNAHIEGRSQSFFVTTSHCSDIQGGNQQTRYFQPDPSSSRIAVEFRDPEYGNPGGLCDDYESARCRLSDALLARYNGTAQPDFGTIARTTFGLQRIGSLIIDEANPRWTIIGEFSFPFEGEVVHKVGRTTGWTMGPVILTCVDVGVGGTDIVQICQDFALAGSRPGDSGAPVFERAGGGSVFLTGVLWGGGTLGGAPVFVFSSMENIEHELGPLTTEAGAAVASAP
jgi:hypothetical protein